MGIKDRFSLPQKLPYTKKKLPKKVIFSYILDYVIIIVLVVGFYILDAVQPFNQPFSLDNYTLYYPYADPERIPVFWALIICGVFPIIVIFIYTIVIDGLFSHQPQIQGAGLRRKLTGRYRLKDRLWELNCGVLGLVLAIGASFVITGALKNAIGKPRPDIFARCKPDEAKLKEIRDTPFKLATSAICTEKDPAIMKDGFRSFPSGHSSSAFAGLFYLSLYLAAKLHVLDSKGEVWKTFLVLVPTLAASLVAGSRIMDARHHPFDVISGSLLGILCAWAAYRQYFPPVTESWRKGRAYPIRSWGKQPEIPANLSQQQEEDLPLTQDRGGHMPVPGGGMMRTGSAGSEGSSQDSHGGNVFRKQVSQSDRARVAAGGQPISPAGMGMGSSTAYSGAPRPPPIPAHATGVPDRFPTVSSSKYSQSSGRGVRGARGRNDVWDESSSEDPDGPEAFELQPTYTLSDAHRNMNAGATYDPNFGTPVEPLATSTRYYGAGEAEEGLARKENSPGFVMVPPAEKEERGGRI